jgi:hypothetical protein
MIQNAKGNIQNTWLPKYSNPIVNANKPAARIGRLNTEIIAARATNTAQINANDRHASPDESATESAGCSRLNQISKKATPIAVKDPYKPKKKLISRTRNHPPPHNKTGPSYGSP